MPTPNRAVRISDDLWQAALVAAQTLDTTITDRVVAALEALVAEAEQAGKDPR